MSQAIGAAVASVRVANLVGSLAIMMFLLFGGFLLNRDQVPWYCQWIADLSYFNYAYEALAVGLGDADSLQHCCVGQTGSCDRQLGHHDVHAVW